LNAALFLARRYVRASRKEAQVGVVGAAAFFGLAVGVGALVVSLALLAGFQTHIRSRLLLETPHLVVTPAGRGDFSSADGLDAKLAAFDGVTSVSPIARGQVWIALRGQLVPAVAIGRAGATGLRLDGSQSRPLGALPEDVLTIVSSRQRLSPLGPVPIVTTLPLEEILPSSTGRRLPEAVLPLEEARRLFALGETGATGYELRLADPSRAAAVGEAIRARLGTGLATTTWEEANRALVLALRLERLVLFATVFLIVVVAGLNLAATSAVLAATRARDAAVLGVLGAGPAVVTRVFVLAGALVGVAGTVAGMLLGTGAAIALDRTGAIPLPAQLYALSHVPFRVEPGDVLLVGALSMVWAVLAASLPARQAARQDLAEVLRGA